MQKIKEAKQIIQDLLNDFPSFECFDLDHSKKDYHEIGENCPVMERLKKNIKKGWEFLKNHERNE